MVEIRQKLKFLSPDDQLFLDQHCLEWRVMRLSRHMLDFLRREGQADAPRLRMSREGTVIIGFAIADPDAIAIKRQQRGEDQVGRGQRGAGMRLARFQRTLREFIANRIGRETPVRPR